MVLYPRKVDVGLSGKGNSNSHGAKPVHLIITMIKWIRTSRLSIQNSLCFHTETQSIGMPSCCIRGGVPHTPYTLHLSPTPYTLHPTPYRKHKE